MLSSQCSTNVEHWNCLAGNRDKRAFALKQVLQHSSLMDVAGRSKQVDQLRRNATTCVI